MKRFLFFYFIIALQTSIYAQIPSNYYDSAIGLNGYTLKTALKNIISTNFNSLSYSQLYTVYQTSDVDSYYDFDGTLLDMYSEIPSGADTYSYDQTTANHCSSSSLYLAEAECFNREHIVPQVVFNYNFPMKSDVHFVFPSDGYVNSQRGSLAFGEVSSPIWISDNGSKKGNNTTSGYSSYVFEPIDEFKGDIARALFYFATRYEDSVSTWNHTMFNNTSNQVFEDWFLDVLLDWHQQDPVDSREIQRNNVIYSYQNNANPFINHPEYVDLIWNNTSDVISPTAPTNLEVNNIASNSVDLNWDASTDNIAVAGYDIYRNGSIVSTSVNTSFTDIGLTSNTNYSYYVVAKDNTPNYSENSNTVSITTLATPVYLVVDSFENNCNNSNFETYSETSTKDWECLSVYGVDNSGSMQMNGYQELVLSKDWLITDHKISFSDFHDIKLSCWLAYAYGTMNLELVYSTDYINSQDPSLSTWIAVPNVVIETSTNSSSITIQNIVNIDISGISEDAHVAFKYYSNGSPTRWTVDNFSITGIENIDIDNTSPSAPINLVASNITNSSVDLNWIASTDDIAVTGYDIYRDGNFISTINTTNYTDNSLIENTIYSYYVIAKDAAGNLSENSNTVDVTTSTIDFIEDVYFQNLKVYPNPTKSNSIKIISDNNFSEIKLYSMLGKLVVHENHLKINHLEIKNIERGIYVLKINSEGKSILKNIIVI